MGETQQLSFTVRQTGDSWHDWGVCELYDLLSHMPWGEGVNPCISADDAGFTFTAVISPDDLATKVHRELSSAPRWNALHPRFPEGKAIDRCGVETTPDGRRRPGEKYDPKVTKAEWQVAGLKGDPPSLARNRCQRLSSLPVTPAKLAQLMDVNGGKESFRQTVLDAINGAKATVTQGANPMVAKHHSNAKVRGASSANSNPDEPASFVLASYLTSVSPWKPFAKGDDCIVLLPESLTFERARRLWTQLKTHVLVDPDSASGEMYRNIPLRADGDEAQLLVLLDALQSSLALKTESPGLYADDIVETNNWQVIHFSSSTSVAVGVIHRICVPGSVFRLLVPIACPSYWKDLQEVTFVRDCLSGIRVENLQIQSLIARALFTPDETWDMLRNTAYLLYKNVDQANKSKRTSVGLLAHFFNHFAKEQLNMEDDTLVACRRIGELTGRTFSKDVTLISRLHNTTSAEELRTNLNLIAFRLFKISTGTEAGAWHISPQEFEKVLDDPDMWQSAAQTISIFASVAAFNKNLDKGDNS